MTNFEKIDNHLNLPAKLAMAKLVTALHEK
jgi:hypothetical protein